jgi:hypothetical protein
VNRFGELPRRVAGVVATGALLVGTGTAIKALHREPPGSPTITAAAAAPVVPAPACTRPAPASWLSAISHREVAAGARPSVVAVDDDSVLGLDPGDQAGAVLTSYPYQPSLGAPKRATPLWRAAPGISDPLVDPDAAAEPGWVVFATPSVHPATEPSRPVEAAGRAVIRIVASHAATTTALVPLPVPGGDVVMPVAPVLIDGVAYWVQGSAVADAEEVLVAASLPVRPDDRVRLPPHARSVQPRNLHPHDVVRLLDVGGQLAWVEQPPQGTARLAFLDADRVPATVRRAVIGGVAFSSDRSMLRWHTVGAGRITGWAWSPGWSQPHGSRIDIGRTYVERTGPFALPAGSGPVGSDQSGGAQVLDERTEAVVVLPPGMRMLVVRSGRAVFTRLSAGGGRLAQVPINELHAVPC